MENTTDVNFPLFETREDLIRWHDTCLSNAEKRLHDPKVRTNELASRATALLERCRCLTIKIKENR